MDSHAGPNSGPRTVKHAVLVPLIVLAAMVVFIGLIATLLLYNTHLGSVALAAVVAGGILLTVSLLASEDRIGRGRGSIVVGAGLLLPLALGGLVALGAIGGVDDADRMINVQPLLVVPEDAPVIAAENATEFCLPTEDGTCEATDRWEVVPSTETETVSFVFDNRDGGVNHNVAITELAGSADDPQPGDDILASDVVPGPTQDFYTDESLTWEDLPEEWFFFCVVHPTTMIGVGAVVTE